MRDSRVEAKRIFAVLQQALAENLVNDREPWLVFHDLDFYRQRLFEIGDVFPPNTLHTVAIKANPAIPLLTDAIERGFGLEAASWEEVQIGLAAGCRPQNLLFDSPAKTRYEIECALDQGVVINANSLEEVQRIASAISHRHKGQIGIRVNPEVGDGTIGATSVAGSDSKFGISIGEYEVLCEQFRRYSWLTGIHVHVGSQGCSMEQLVAGASRTVSLAKRINQEIGSAQIAWVDIGGGLPVSYGQSEEGITFADYAAELAQEIPELFNGTFRIVTEFGRAVHANCGWAASRIEYIDARDDCHRVTVHFGADFLMRPVYRPDEWTHQYFLTDGMGYPKTDSDTTLVDVAGPLCFGGDFPARGVFLPRPSLNDCLIVRDVGAYTLSLWSRHCNRAMPSVIGYYESQGQFEFETIFRREMVEDIVRRWER